MIHSSRLKFPLIALALGAFCCAFMGGIGPPTAQAQVAQCLLAGHQVNCSGTQRLFLATPSGASGNVTLRSITAVDLPNLAGDANGPYTATLVTALRNVPISIVPPLGGQFLGYDGASWVPTTLPSTGPGSNQVVAITDTAAAACDVARRVVATGHFEVATGAAATDSDNVVGVYLAAYAPGAQATVVKSGGLAACAALAQGPLYRSALGKLVAYGSLVVNDFTVKLGVSSALGTIFDVDVGEGQQVAP